MILLIVGGLVSLLRLNTQFFPNFSIDVITVTIEWPGASTTDIETNIIAPLEPEVRFLDSVEKVNSFATEGWAHVVVEFQQGADMQKALAEVDSAVLQITTLPEDSGKPIVKRAINYETISRVSLSGAFSESALKSIAKRMRDDLLSRGIDRVTLFGARDEEIWVDITPATLRKLDLTMADVAKKIQDHSINLPSGKMDSGSEKQIRSLGLETHARDIAGIEIRSLRNGQKIHLRDFAKVREEFDDSAAIGLVDGGPAVELHIQRSANADALKTARLVDLYLAEMIPTLPSTLRVQQYDIQVNLIRDRIYLLLKNGIGGLVLVLAILFLFLSYRVAFWVAAGIPVALFATLVVMFLSGQSINMVSLFALIMTLGIIVDDAIVVGEHAAYRWSEGNSSLDSSEGAALRMLAPVTAASLTTVAAFLPLLVIGDIIGTIIKAIPLVAISVLIASLVECFLVLPMHLRESFRRQHGAESRFRIRFNQAFDQVRDTYFRAIIESCLSWRYTTLAVAVGVLVISVAVVIGGRVNFIFFPSPESDVVFGNVVMTPGTGRGRTADMVRELERAAAEAARELEPKNPLLRASFGSVGLTQGRPFERLTGDRYGGLYVELVASDSRRVRTPEFIAAWRRNIKTQPGLVRISLNERAGGPPGREVDIRLMGGTAEQLKTAALELRDVLTRFEGVSDIEDDLPFGKQEIILQVTPRGQALGFNTSSIGQQVRNAFEGAIAKRFPRDDEEVLIRVRYSSGPISNQSLMNLYLRAPSGAEVPLVDVVTLREDRGFARIRHRDGQREAVVFAELDENRINLNQLMPAIIDAGLPALAERNGVSYRFAGKAEEQAKTLADMKLGGVMGLAFIYIILAWVFSSYMRPLVVMFIIPFSAIGVVAGHALFGYDLTILSIVGLIGLSGIVVNDSIILVSTIDERISGGEEIIPAIVNGSQDRLRAVLLTSLTTIGGLTPLLFETSLQAQFLIPMALTIVSGLAVATFLVLILVPALLAIQNDFQKFDFERGASFIKKLKEIGQINWRAKK